MDVSAAIENRRSIRKYQAKPLSEEDMAKLLAAAVCHHLPEMIRRENCWSLLMSRLKLNWLPPVKIKALLKSALLFSSRCIILRKGGVPKTA